MTKKLVWVLIALLVVVLSTNFVSSIDCSMAYDVAECYRYYYSSFDGSTSTSTTYTTYTCDSGGIGGLRCSNGECIIPNDEYRDVDCIVSSSQYINTKTSSELTYAMKSLTVSAGAELRFYNSEASIGGGANGSLGTGGADKGDNGGNGGKGGAILKEGASGAGGHNQCSDCDCWCDRHSASLNSYYVNDGYISAGRGGNAGANIKLKVRDALTNNGIISVSGYDGGNGQNGEGSCGRTGGRYGGAGTGGGGGGGAGIIKIISTTLDGSGKFEAKGGNGGIGGQGGTQDCDGSTDYNCGQDNDRGGTAGNGAGGNGGTILIDDSIQLNAHFSTTPQTPTDMGYIIGTGFGGVVSSSNNLGGGCSWYISGNCPVDCNGVDQGRFESEDLGDTEQNYNNQAINNPCNNANDDDLDGLTDMQDPDCYNIETDAKHPGYCVSSNYGPTGGIYGSSKENGKTNTGIISGYESAKNGSDACCGDDTLKDYGFIAQGFSGQNIYRQYMCYGFDTPHPNVESTPMYTWLDAMKVRYEITTLRFSKNKTVDVISNSQDWYYCDATGRKLLNDGIAIPEYGTYNNLNQNNEMSCIDIATILFGVDFTDCNQEALTFDACCTPNSNSNIYDPENCYQNCYYENHPLDYYSRDKLCEITVGGCPNGDGSQTDNDGTRLVTKNSCPSDPDAISCVDTYSPIITSDCDSQILPTETFRTVNCENPTDLCSNGTFIDTSIPTEKCCAGESAYCKSVPVLATQNDCLLAKGIVYSTDQYTCESSAPIGNTGSSCCFGLKIPKSDYLLIQKASSVSNSSFICFKQDGQDVIADCCFDNSSCQNSELIYHYQMSFADSRVSSLGGVFHTIENFDGVIGGKIVDQMKLYTISEDSSNTQDVWMTNPRSDLNLSHFAYIEFDIEFSTTMDVSINNYPQGKLSKYLNNGDKPKRRHHVIIPILKENGKSIIGDYVTKISFTVDSTPASFLIDNIILTPDTTVGSNDLSYNSKNYYCSGDFEGWIQDLDPPTTFTSQDLSDWDKKGPYVMTCNSQGAFGWSGTMCCGDDTKRNYGEFYNDSMYGCFNGSLIKNGWSLGYAKNYYESNQLSRDQLDEYAYSGLLYFNNTFIGCQIENHDAKLNISRYGIPNATRLVNKFNDTQCAVIGDYYCMNSVWRSEVLTNDAHSGVADITLKTAPMGVELIKNGFRGNSQ